VLKSIELRRRKPNETMGGSVGDAVGGGIPGSARVSGIPDVDWTKNVRVPVGGQRAILLQLN